MGEIRQETAHRRRMIGKWIVRWGFGKHPARWFWHRSPGLNWTLRVPWLFIQGVKRAAAFTPQGDTE